MEPAVTKRSADRVSRVTVTKLFDSLDHTIDFNQRTKATVVNGPNGIGKTVILKMIMSAVAGTSQVFNAIPFKRFTIEFSSGDYCIITPNDGSTNHPSYSARMEGSILRGQLSGLANKEKTVDTINSNYGGNWHFEETTNQFVDLSDGETISTSSMQQRYRDHTGSATTIVSFGKPRELVDPLERKSRVRMIGTDRLIAHASPNTLKRADRIYWQRAARTAGRLQPNQSFTSSVQYYADHLSALIRSATESYVETATELDRSFVKRTISNAAQNDPIKVEELELAERKRIKLSKLGILPDSASNNIFNEGSSIPKQAIESLINRSPDLMTVYTRDMLKKLEIFDDLEARLAALRKLINQRFLLKTIDLDPESGITVKHSRTGADIPLTALSSGEQHQIIILYELIMMSRNGDLILIDEPELSLHIQWQITLIDDLRKAFQGLDVDLLLATHSPSIIENCEDEEMIVDLMAPAS